METDRIYVLLPDELKREAKVKAAREDTTVSDVVRAFLAAWTRGTLQVPAGELAPASAR